MNIQMVQHLKVTNIKHLQEILKVQSIHIQTLLSMSLADPWYKLEFVPFKDCNFCLDVHLQLGICVMGSL
jgi:hypothetical protein